MRFIPIVIVIGIASASPAFAADRMTDRDVKNLVSRVEDGRDRFDNALDNNLKRQIVRGPGGEVNVDNFLNDFQESIDKLEKRLTPEYAASAEVATVLRQASAIDRFFKQQPPGTKGESEWNRLATDLKTLATAYGAEFPLAEGAPVRRMGDGEVAKAAEQISKSAEQLKKSLDGELKKTPSVDKQTRESIVGEADQLSKDAKSLRDRVKDSKPSSAEAEQLIARASKMQGIFAGRQLPASMGVWGGLSARLRDLASAFRVQWPTT